MTLLIIVFGNLILLAEAVLVKNPEVIFRLLRNNIENSLIQVIAVVVRLIIGTLLIIQSSVSRFPMGIEVLGWVFIVAGFSLAVIGRNNFRKLVSWVLIRFEHFGRLAGVIAIAFGGFLVYAFL